MSSSLYKGAVFNMIPTAAALIVVLSCSIAKAAASFTVCGVEYQSIELLGSGAFGTVYRVTDPQDQVFALKVLDTSTEKNVKMAQHEVEFANMMAIRWKQLPSKYIVEYICAENAMVVMEYIDGYSVNPVRNPAKAAAYFTEPRVAVYLGRLCRALIWMRRFYIVHRDLKPGNILFLPKGNLKVIDFGLSTRMSDDSRHTGRFGTLVYMAPEMLAGDAYGPNVDLYSVGVILYEMLFQEPLFTARTEKELAETILAFYAANDCFIGRTHEIESKTLAKFIQSLLCGPTKRATYSRDFFQQLRDVEIEMHLVPPPSSRPS